MAMPYQVKLLIPLFRVIAKIMGGADAVQRFDQEIARRSALSDEELRADDRRLRLEMIRRLQDEELKDRL